MPALPDNALLRKALRIVRFGALVAAAGAVVRALRGTPTPPVTGQASWPPLKPDAERPARTEPVQFAAPAATGDGAPDAPTPTTPTEGQTWVLPVDGKCPESHPIKGNADSMIFHVPGGMSYERTIPERCYATEADAEADGFRRAKR